MVCPIDGGAGGELPGHRDRRPRDRSAVTSNAFASFRSRVSKPSQLYMGASGSRACCSLPVTPETREAHCGAEFLALVTISDNTNSTAATSGHIRRRALSLKRSKNGFNHRASSTSQSDNVLLIVGPAIRRHERRQR